MPVSDRQIASRQARHDARAAAAKKVIPPGPYCYRHTGETRPVHIDGAHSPINLPIAAPCPYWSLNGKKSPQANGYCSFMKAGDWMPYPHGTSLLWDQVKECGINSDDPNADHVPG